MAPRRRFGQHFLTSPGTADRIVALAGIEPGMSVLEVGPGPGQLTRALLRAGANVTAVEIDRDLAAALRRELPEVRLVEGDATTVDLTMLPPGTRCVANLPYNVGTRIVTRFLELPGTFERLVVMLQREVGLRLAAPPGDRARGSLSVFAQARAEVRGVLKVRPGAFHPPPKVDSLVVELRLRPQPLIPGDVTHFDEVVRSAFSAPRKTVANALRGTWGDAAGPALVLAGIDPGARAATLELDAFARLALALADSR